MTLRGKIGTVGGGGEMTGRGGDGEVRGSRGERGAGEGGGAGGEGGAVVLRCRQRKGGGGGGGRLGTAALAAITGKYSWPGQGVAAVVAAAAAMAVGLLPRPSVSSHSRWRNLLSFLK